MLHLLRTDEMNVSIHSTGRHDLALRSDHLGTRPDDNLHSGLNVRITGLADCVDAAVPQADIGLDYAPVIENDCVGDDCIDRSLRATALTLGHAVANHLAAAEFDLFARNGVIRFHPDEQFRVGQPDPIPGRRPVHGGVCAAAESKGH